jgi:general secretion pathway protein B
MSYILEALKKAESERERGAVPGLSSTQTNTTTYIRYRNGSTQWWLVGLALVTVAVAVVGFWSWRQPALQTQAVPPVNQAVAPATAIAPAPSTARVPVPVAPPVAAVAVVPAVPVAVPAPVAQTKQGPAVAASSVAPVVAKAPASAPAPMQAPTARNASSGIPLYSELPESLRRQMPILAISGAIYSDSPAEWTLIVNDQVLGKGSQVAPELRLEDISGSSATFNFKGQRFRMEH